MSIRRRRARQEEWGAQKATLAALEAAVQQAVRQTDARQGERTRRLQERSAREAALKAAQERLTEPDGALGTNGPRCPVACGDAAGDTDA